MGDSVQQKAFLRTIRVKCSETIPSWNGLDLELIEAVPLVGGCSNLLWKVSQRDSTIQPSCVVFRRYCASDIVDRETEANIMQMLMEEGITVRVYVDEESYRIEDFIVGSHPKEDEIFTDDLLRIMAKLHSHQNDSIEPVAFRRLTRLSHLAKEVRQVCENTPLQVFHEVNIEEEINWLKQQFSQHSFLQGLCHNDLHALNILQTKDKPEFYNKRNPIDIILIDFEFADFNYLACEWANSFYELCMDNAADDWPHFKFNKSKWPSQDLQRELISRYFEHMFNKPAEQTFVDNFLSQIEVCLLLQHMHWALWSLPSFAANSKTHAIEWGYAEYGAFRLKQYFDLKNKLILNSNLISEPSLGHKQP